MRETNTYYLKININKFLVRMKVDEYQEINLQQAQKLMNIEKKVLVHRKLFKQDHDILRKVKKLN